MVDVFITDIDHAQQAQRTTTLLESRFAALRFHVDMDGSQAVSNFPALIPSYEPKEVPLM